MTKKQDTVPGRVKNDPATNEETKPTSSAEAPTVAPPAAPLQMQCKVLENGMIYGEAMHAKGKILAIDEAKANALAAMTPPKVEILGIK